MDLKSNDLLKSKIKTELEEFKNSELSFKLYASLHTWSEKEIIHFILCNKSINSLILEELFDWNGSIVEDDSIKYIISQRAILPKSLISKIINETSEFFLESVALSARNQKIINLLSKHNNSLIRENIVFNMDASEEILLNLCADKELHVRKSFFDVDTFSDKIYEKLSKDENTYISSEAIKILKKRNRQNF